MSAALMVVAAVGSALAPSLALLIAFRFLLGFGVGGDYPVSAVLMSEYAGRSNRGRMVALVFSAQAVGLIVGPVVALALLGGGGGRPSPQIMALITPHASQTTTIAIQLAIFAVAAVPGYALAVWRMDRIGHRRLQLVGFIMMGACFAVIGLVPGMTTAVAPFLLAYGISYFFTEFGPNVTTFVLPGELFPTRFRATGHGISAGIGKLGAFIGVFLSPSSSTPSGCAARCCSPPGYRSWARC